MHLALIHCYGSAFIDKKRGTSMSGSIPFSKGQAVQDGVLFPKGAGIRSDEKTVCIVGFIVMMLLEFISFQ